MVLDRFAAGVLQLGVDRGVHLEPALADGVDPVLLDQLLLDEVEEVGLADLLVAVAGIEVDALVDRVLVLALADVSLLLHLFQHLVAALQGRPRVLQRVVQRRRLGDAGEHRGLGEGEVVGLLRVVDLRGGLDAHRRAAVDRPVGGGVEVVLEDPLLGVLLLELLGDLRLLDLALQVTLGVVDVEVAGELHRDRRSALLHLAGLEVLERRAGDSLEVDAVVLVEALVLDRDRRLLQILGDLVDR